MLEVWYTKFVLPLLLNILSPYFSVNLQACATVVHLSYWKEVRMISVIYFFDNNRIIKARKEFKKLDCKNIQIYSKDDTINVQVNDQVNVQVNNQNLSTLFGVSEKAIRRDLYVLLDMNLIHHVGSIRQSIEKLHIKRSLTAQVVHKFRPSSAQVSPQNMIR